MSQFGYEQLSPLILAKDKNTIWCQILQGELVMRSFFFFFFKPDKYHGIDENWHDYSD